MYKRPFLVSLTSLFVLACDPQAGDREALSLADEDDVDVDAIAVTPVVSEAPHDAPDADAPLGVDPRPLLSPPCRTQSVNTDTSSYSSSCTAAMPPFYLDDLESIMEIVGEINAVADCATSGHGVGANGQSRCHNVCAGHGQTWQPDGLDDFGVCLVNATYTTSPVTQVPAPQACPGTQTKITYSVHATAQCGCTCSP